jgi:hypothetical protein
VPTLARVNRALGFPQRADRASAASLEVGIDLSDRSPR